MEPDGSYAGPGPERQDPIRLGTNPFIVVLWIVAAGLVLSGLGMIVQARNPLASGPGNSEYMPMSYLLLNFSPYVLLAGILTAIGLIFWHAARWQNRPVRLR